MKPTGEDTGSGESREETVTASWVRGGEGTVTASWVKGGGGSDGKDNQGDSGEVSFIHELSSKTLFFVCYDLANRKKC